MTELSADAVGSAGAGWHRRPKAWIGHLLGKGAWAVTDQALFAGSNFILNIFLVRWLSPANYGAFGVAFAIFLLLGTAHTSLLTEPMMVFGAGRLGERRGDYLRVLLGGQVAFSLACAVVLLALGGVLAGWGAGALAWAVLGLAVAGPLMLWLWLMRRACYLRMEPHLAACGGFVYLMLMMAGLWVVNRAHALSPAAAMGIMGISSAMVALWLTRRLRVSRTSASSELRGQVIAAHWDYGRWAAGTQAIGWLPRNIYYLLLPASADLAHSGALRAMMNLTLPITHANTALAVLLIPALVRAREDGTFQRMLRLSLGLLVAAGAVYWVLLGVLHRPLIALLYRGHYQEYGYLLWLVGASLIPAGVIDVVGSALRAMQRPDQMFWSNVVSTVAAITVGVACMALWGVAGAAIGLTISSVVKAAVMWVYYRRLETRQRQESAQEEDVDAAVSGASL